MQNWQHQLLECIMQFSCKISLHVVTTVHCVHKKVVYLIFTVQCTIVQSMVLRSHVVCLSICLSVCDVDGS